MQCPKCGAENPNNTTICNSCGHNLEKDFSQKPIKDPKTSRLAIATLVLSILSLSTVLIMLFISLALGIFLFLIVALLSITLGIVSLCIIKKRKGELKGAFIAVTGIFISAVPYAIILALLCIDAPPIPNDYTIADFRSAPPDCAKSYEFLKSFSPAEEDVNAPGAPTIGLSAEDIHTNITPIKFLKKAITQKSLRCSRKRQKV